MALPSAEVFSRFNCNPIPLALGCGGCWAELSCHSSCLDFQVMITLRETAPLPKAPKHQVLLWLLLDLFPVLILGWEQWTGSHGTWQMVFCSSPVMLGLPSIFSRKWGPLHSLGHRLGQGLPLAARTFPLLLLLQPIYTCHRIREWMSPRSWASKLSTTEVEGESLYLPPVLFLQCLEVACISPETQSFLSFTQAITTHQPRLLCTDFLCSLSQVQPGW